MRLPALMSVATMSAAGPAAASGGGGLRAAGTPSFLFILLRAQANTTCRLPMLYDLSTDLGERHDVSAEHPDVLKAIMNNFTRWHNSVLRSIETESRCPAGFAGRSMYDEACPEGSAPGCQ